jgi:transposase
MKQVFNKEQFAAFIGIDWADAKHDLCLQKFGCEKVESSILKHTPEAIEEWASALRRRFGGKSVAICLELNKGPLVYALSKYDFIVLFPVNPLTVARFREAFATSGAKDDPSDAQLQLEILLTHRHQLRPLKPSSPAIRALEQLVEHRRRLVDDKVRLNNRMTSILKNYFPQVLGWFKDRDTKLFCDFLTRWPTLASVQRARRPTLEHFFHTHHVRSSVLIKKRIEGIKTAVALTTDEAIIVPNALLTKALITQLRVVLTAIREFDGEIELRFQGHADFVLFDSFPGAGAALAPRLLVAFGDQRERYTCADEMQKLSGVAPVTKRSGNQYSVHCRWRCPKYLRQTFVEWSSLSIHHSFWARAYYEQKRAQGKSHQVAVRALAYKWIRIVYRCWQDRRPYDESVYLRALQRRGSPLFKYLANAT